MMPNPNYDLVAHRYNLLSSLISIGLDSRLRNTMAGEVSGKTVIDIGTGTGKSALAICHRNCVEKVVGVDPSEKMLEVAEADRERREQAEKVVFSRATGENLPFHEGYFDCATTAFAIKHSEKPQIFLREILRVLKPGGKIILMEAAIPETAFTKVLFTFHIKTLVPLIASFFGLGGQYKTFHQSTQRFCLRGDLREMMKSAGFQNVCRKSFLFGSAVLCTGDKPARRFREQFSQ